MSDPCVLVVSADASFRQRAARWVAAAGARLVDVADLAQARPHWRSATVIIIAADQLAVAAASVLPRHEKILVVAPGTESVWRDAVTLGASVITDASDTSAVMEALTAAVDGNGEACLVAVLGANGGVGASTFAVALAQEATRRAVSSLVIDVDPFGGGLDLVIGAEHEEGLRWGDLTSAEGHVAAASLSEALPRRNATAVLSHGRGAGAVSASVASPGPLLRAALHGFDVVIADVPRGGLICGDRLATEAVGAAVLTVVMVRDDLRGLAAAARINDLAAQTSASLATVVRTVPGGLGAFEVERALGTPVLATVTTQRGLARAVELGLGPGGARKMRRVAGGVLDVVGVSR